MTAHWPTPAPVVEGGRHAKWDVQVRPSVRPTASKDHQALNAQAGRGREQHREAMHRERHSRWVNFLLGVDEQGKEVWSEPKKIHTTGILPWTKRRKNRQKRKAARRDR